MINILNPESSWLLQTTFFSKLTVLFTAKINQYINKYKQVTDLQTNAIRF